MKMLDSDREREAGRGGADAVAHLPEVSRPRRYAARMAGFLAAVGVVAVLLHEPAIRFFLRNPPLNALILAVLGVGIVLTFRAVLSLEPEVRWMRRLQRNDPGLRRDAPPLLGGLATLMLESKGPPALSAAAMRGVLDGVDSRLDERRETSRYLIALLIFLGLLGTFWGLLVTATSVGDTIRGLNVATSDPAEMFETLRAGLEAPLGGMGTAFSTSLFGLACSLVLGFLDLQASQAQNRFANELEAWLTALVRSDAPTAWDEDAPAPSYLYALLTKTSEGFEELQARLERAGEESARTNAALRTLGGQLAALTDEIRAASARAGSTGTDVKVAVLLERIAGALDERSHGFDDAMRAHLRSLDLAVAQLVEDGARGREQGIEELRGEIRLLARTLAAIADRKR